jgi:hypothetical protein
MESVSVDCFGRKLFCAQCLLQTETRQLSRSGKPVLHLELAKGFEPPTL